MTKYGIPDKLYRLLTIAILFVWIIPFFLLLYISLLKVKTLYEIDWGRIFVSKHSYDISKYTNLLTDKTFLIAALNTFVISILSATITISLALGVAYYIFISKNQAAKRSIMVITFLLIGIPVQITLASNTFVFNQLGLYSTIFSIILVHIALGMPFITVILHNALRKVPNSVYYLSEIDDLNLFNRLIYIYLPLIKGSIFNIAIYQMIWTSNDLLIGMTFGDEKNRPLTTFIQGQIRQFNNSYDVVIPATVLSTIIPIAMGIILLNLGERKA